MKRIFIVYFFLVYIPVSGQFKDTFSDGEFTSMPKWSGDNAFFVVQNDMLRSNGLSVADVLHLSTPSIAINEATWEFLIKMTFSPSNANQVRIYLVSDNKNLEETLNGYFLQIGQSGEDVIKFYRQNGLDEELVFSGRSVFMDQVRVRVTRDNLGNWQILRDSNGGNNFVSEGASFQDNTYTNTSYFGVVCKHTSTRGNGFFFDDFLVTVAPDITPPGIAKIKIVSNILLDVYFNEPVDEIKSETTTNYTIDKDIGTPSFARLDGVNNSLVHLSFTNLFSNNTTYQMTVQHVEDINGNAIHTLVKPFTVLILEVAIPDDIIINEIMADPSPQRKLPNAEYIEIYNRSDKYIDLANYTLNGAKIAITQKIIHPGEYVILCDDRDKDLLKSYGKIIGVASWNILANKGETISLMDASISKKIDTVKYRDSWYKSIDKQDGGWSLELIDPENSCGEEFNWTASIDDRGGTPGRINSVFANKPDLTGPQLLSALGVSQDSLILKFDERLDITVFKSAIYTFTPLLVVDHSVLSENGREITIVFSNLLEYSLEYQITVSQLRDCNGNLIGRENSKTFALPKIAEQGDLLLNELLYNPVTEGGDFVEVYNYSTKYIDLKGWRIANGSEEVPKNARIISKDHLVIAPQQYLVFTEEVMIVSSDYPRGVLENFVQVSSLPSFPNDGQGVLLINPQSDVFDYFPYDENMQHPLLNSTKGVSLERISFDSPTTDKHNWHSAARSEGFATPGYVNSQTFEWQVNGRDQVVVSPKIFLPNQSGQSDFVTISYSFDQPGFVANVSIVDFSGRIIKKIAQNELLGTKGFFQWNGTMKNGSKARSQPYIVHFEVFDLSGNQQVHKKRVIIVPEL